MLKHITAFTLLFYSYGPFAQADEKKHWIDYVEISNWEKLNKVSENKQHKEIYKYFDEIIEAPSITYSTYKIIGQRKTLDYDRTQYLPKIEESKKQYKKMVQDFRTNYFKNSKIFPCDLSKYDLSKSPIDYVSENHKDLRDMATAMAIVNLVIEKNNNVIIFEGAEYLNGKSLGSRKEIFRETRFSLDKGALAFGMEDADDGPSEFGPIKFLKKQSDSHAENKKMFLIQILSLGSWKKAFSSTLKNFKGLTEDEKKFLIDFSSKIAPTKDMPSDEFVKTVLSNTDQFLKEKNNLNSWNQMVQKDDAFWKSFHNQVYKEHYFHLFEKGLTEVNKDFFQDLFDSIYSNKLGYQDLQMEETFATLNISVELRNFVFVKNIGKAYCKALEEGSPLFVILGRLHTPGVSRLLQEEAKDHKIKQRLIIKDYDDYNKYSQELKQILLGFEMVNVINKAK